jgi:RNA polymerase sigma factor (sigma-70 family)
MPAPAALRPLLPRRLLAVASDERLVEQIWRGNEAAFAVAFERHAAGLIGFCRHMVGTREEAEDVVQHTFLAAFRQLALFPGRELALRPWLYAVARRRCLSILRARHEQAALDFEIPTKGLTEEIERRADLRVLFRDLRDLPEEQRAALVLSEAGDLSHAEVARVLGCDVANVKALVFRARSSLIDRRDAREAPCAHIREQLANLRGNSLRRNELRHHLRSCAACRDYREHVKRQRRTLADALPLDPSPELRSGVLVGAGLGGGSCGGGLAAGLATGMTACFSAGTLVKVAAVGLLLGGAATSGRVLIAEGDRPIGPMPAPAAHGVPSSAPLPSSVHAPVLWPVANEVRRVEARADADGSHTRAHGQQRDAPPPATQVPDGERGLHEEQDVGAAPQADGAQGAGQESDHGDDGGAVRSTPEDPAPVASPPAGGRRASGSPPSEPPAAASPPAAPGGGGPRPGDPGQGLQSPPPTPAPEPVQGPAAAPQPPPASGPTEAPGKPE